jgi:hypothetical protein
VAGHVQVDKSVPLLTTVGSAMYESPVQYHPAVQLPVGWARPSAMVKIYKNSVNYEHLNIKKTDNKI